VPVNSNEFRELFQDSDGISGHGPADRDEFDDVDTPLTTLVFGYEGLRFGKPCGQLMLRQPGGFSSLGHEFAQRGLRRRMNRFVEFAPA
jgi:hypothetical protein